MIVAILLVPCCGGTALIGALTGDDKPAPSTAAEHLAAEPATTNTTTEQAGDLPSAQPAATDPAATNPAEVPTLVPSSKPAALHVVTKKKVTQRKAIAFTTRTVKDSDLAKGKSEVRTKGVAGVRTITYEVTMTDGAETSRKQVGSVVTKQPVAKVVAVGTKTGGNCDSNYSGCVPVASDVDCAGGTGDGPAYVSGPVRVTGTDIYRLDNDKDGVACES